MSQPTPYSRQYNFTNYQTVNPATPLPAAEVDLELNSVKATLDQVLNNLKLIQRDDTALANKSVGIDQLKAEVTIGINPPAPWVTAHAYIKNDTVTQGGIFYLCLVSHTSGVFNTDLGAGDWSLIIDFNGIGFDLAAATHGAVAKTIPNDSDEMALSDSAQTWSLKKATWANLKAAVFAAWGALIAVGTVKSTPADGDAFAYMDSASSNATKVTTWASMKSAMFTAFGPVIAAATAKTTPVLADMLLLVDSAASNVSKMVTLSNFFAAVFTDFGNRISLGTVKSTPVDGDAFGYMDSAASNATKVLTWLALKTTLKTYLDTLYQPLKAILTSLGALANAAGVLTNDGSGGLSWGSPPAAGAVLLATMTPTGSPSTLTSANFVSTSYLSLEIVLDNLTMSSNSLTVNISTDNGSTFDTAQTTGADGPSYNGAIKIYRAGITATHIFESAAGSRGRFTTKTGPITNIRFSGSAMTAGVAYVYGVP